MLEQNDLNKERLNSFTTFRKESYFSTQETDVPEENSRKNSSISIRNDKNDFKYRYHRSTSLNLDCRQSTKEVISFGDEFLDNLNIDRPRYFTKNLVIFELRSKIQTYLYPNKNIKYIGEAQNNKPHGNGVFYYDNGIKAYEGEFIHGERDGNGTLYSKKTGKLIYYGYWVKNDKYSTGKLYNEDGKKIYSGLFNKNVRDGFGTSYYPETGNLKYYGEWVNDMQDGSGIFYYDKNNEEICYEGNWSRNTKDGQGKL